MREIINQPQADMLAVMAVCDTDKSSILKQSGVYKHQFTRGMADLRERGLVESYMPGAKKGMLYMITMSGRRALADHSKHHEMLMREPEKAQPARRNLFEFPVYVPPTNGYVRNGGNKHIQSRGMSV